MHEVQYTGSSSRGFAPDAVSKVENDYDKLKIVVILIVIVKLGNLPLIKVYKWYKF